MTRSRQRISDFEARSVQIIAAFTLSVAGMSALQNTAAPRASNASPSTLSTQATAALANPRNLAQRTSTGAQRTNDRHR